MNQEQKNLLEAMKLQLAEPNQIKFTGRIHRGSAGRRLPAVESFEVVTNTFNLLLEQIGVSLRLPPKLKGKDTTMNKCNRYMSHQVKRILKYKYTNPQLAGHIACLCVKYSVSFRMSAINHVIPDGYFKHHTNEIGRICRKVDKLLYTWDYRLDYKRVYIPKANGKVRPLGVPTVEGRIVLHMGNNMFVEMLRMEIGKDQHAYIPGRGSKTAGMSIIRKSRKYKYIYETDLKGFFDNISVHSIRNVLLRNNINIGLLNFINKIFQAKPKLPKSRRMDERKFNDVITYKKSDGLNGPDYKRPEIAKHVFRYLHGWQSTNPEVKNSLAGKNFGINPGGVPQGMPLSPLLAILPLKEKYLNQADHVNYADDQVFFMNEPKEIKDSPNDGIIHNKEKCRGVKWDGKGTEDGLKFLGFRMKEFDIFHSETRSGKREYVKSEIRKMFDESTFKKLKKIEEKTEFGKILSEYHEKGSKDESRWLENVAKRNFFGFVMACMNNAAWENDKQRIYHAKALRNLLGKVNKKSPLGHLPTALSSSSAMYFLHSVVMLTKRRKKSAKQFFKL